MTDPKIPNGMAYSNKAPELEEKLNRFARLAFGRQRTGSQCVTCGSKDVASTDFKDSLSWKEFGFSHLCQICQDKVF